MEPGRTSGLLSTAKRLRPPFTAYGYSTRDRDPALRRPAGSPARPDRAGSGAAPARRRPGERPPQARPGPALHRAGQPLARPAPHALHRPVPGGGAVRVLVPAPGSARLHGGRAEPPRAGPRGSGFRPLGDVVGLARFVRWEVPAPTSGRACARALGLAHDE